MTASAADVTWAERLRKMPITNVVIERSNAIPVILASFRADGLPGGIVFLPSVADQFYLIERGRPLDLRVSNLWEAVVALTNRTTVGLTVFGPFLVFHTGRERPSPDIQIKHRGTAVELQQSRRWPNLLLVDHHWQRVQPEAQKYWGYRIAPAKMSEDAWHFGRHNVVGTHLTDWQVLQGLSLANGSSVVVGRKKVVFSRKSADRGHAN